MLKLIGEKIKDNYRWNTYLDSLYLFKNRTNNLRFHLTFKTADLQDIIFTIFAKDINVTNKILYLNVPIVIPNSDTQVLFIESFKINYTITNDSWYVE